MNDIFTIFNDMKELLQMSKLLKCIKKISTKAKNCNIIFKKMLIIIQELDVFATELDINNDD